MTMQGYTKSWRKKYAGKSATRGLLYVGAMDWLVGNANFKDGWTHGKKCGRGQLFVGRAALAQIWRVSEQTVRTILKNLESDGFLTSESTNAGTVVTITNYDVYQADDERYQPTDQPATNQRILKIIKKSTNESTNREGVLTDSISTACDGLKKSDQPTDQPAINQPGEKNQPLKKNNTICVCVGEPASKPDTSDTVLASAESENGLFQTKNHQRFEPPKDVSEVQRAAVAIGYAMDNMRAREFMDHYGSLGWRLNGGYIVDWRKLLPRWKANDSSRKGATNYGRRKDGIDNGKRVSSADAFAGLATEI